MRFFATFVLFFFFLNVKSQEPKKDVVRLNSHFLLDPKDFYPPAMFINSIKSTNISLYYIDPHNIKNIKVKRGFLDTINKTYGRVYIKLKSKVHFLTLNDITIKYGQNRIINKMILYMIDKKIITDTTGIRIDSNIIREVSIINPNQSEYPKNINISAKADIFSIETSLGTTSN